jgi:hypothetical protein
MRNSPRALAWASAAVSVLLLTACGEAAATTAPADTPTETAPPTRTLTPSTTDTPTLSLTPTETPTFTPTLPYNAPGSYIIMKCNTYSVKSGESHWLEEVKVSIKSVTVQKDGTMRVNVDWMAVPNQNAYFSYAITLESFEADTSIVLMDNLENEYRHFSVGGCLASGSVLYYNHSTCGGWFDFPAAEPGATSFNFIDFRHGFSIENIVLLKRDPGSTPTFTLTVDPNMKFNAPGTYYIYQCAVIPSPASIPGASRVKICLITVVVGGDFRMKFNILWTAYFDYAGTAAKESDREDERILVEDNLKNIYRPVEIGGCAGLETVLFTDKNGGDASCGGWFLFPPAEPDATSFRYEDPKNGISFEGIVLENP